MKDDNEAVDFSKEMLQECKKNLKEHGTSGPIMYPAFCENCKKTCWSIYLFDYECPNCNERIKEPNFT